MLSTKKDQNWKSRLLEGDFEFCGIDPPTWPELYTHKTFDVHKISSMP